MAWGSQAYQGPVGMGALLVLRGPRGPLALGSLAWMGCQAHLGTRVTWVPQAGLVSPGSPALWGHGDPPGLMGSVSRALRGCRGYRAPWDRRESLGSAASLACQAPRVMGSQACPA